MRKTLQDENINNYYLGKLGAGLGLGSSIYALLRVGKLLDEPELVKEALSRLKWITPKMFEDDMSLDVIGGSAGFILCMAALHRETGNSEALELAHSCGTSMLRKRTLSVNGRLVWSLPGRTPLAGFAHGMAGISHALVKLFEITSEGKYLEAASDALAYENSLFSEEAHNWADLRDIHNPGFMTAWCHGAGGIGLQRASSLHLLDTTGIREDIHESIIAIRQKLASIPSQSDHLCCGNMGLIEAVSSIGRLQDRKELIRFARQAAKGVILSARENGGYQCASYLPRGLASPGLFQGCAGIGYGLLRLTYPDIFPNILLF